MGFLVKFLKGFAQKIFLTQVDPWTKKISLVKITLAATFFLLITVSVAFLLYSKPFEKRKMISADKQRVQDLQILKTALISYQEDFGQLPKVSEGVRFLTGGRDSPTEVENNWLGVNLSKYAKLVPVDPKFLSNSTAPYAYRYTTDGVTFKLDAFLQVNSDNLMQQDGGIANIKGTPVNNRARYEVGTNLLLGF